MRSCDIHIQVGLLLAAFLWVPALAGAQTLAEQRLSPCVEPPAGLLAWWPLDESAPSIAFDLVDGNHGTHLGQPESVPGVVDDALSFDGLNDAVVIPDDGLLDIGAGDFSIDAWVRTSAGGILTILDKRSATPHGYHFFLFNGRPGLQLAFAGRWRNFVAPASVATGQWTHVAVTVDRDDPQGITFYVDGTQSGPPRDPTGFAEAIAVGSPLVLGRRSFEAAGYWDGELDEIELFNRELARFEIAVLESAGRAGKCKCASLDCGPVASWPLDLASFGARDLAGHVSGPHDGEIQGAQPVTGKVGGALLFDGDDLVEVRNTSKLALNLEKPGAFSVSAWILVTNGLGYRPIVSVLAPLPTDLTIGYSLSLSEGTLAFSLASVDPANPLMFPEALGVQCQDPRCQNLADGQWHLVGATMEWDAGGQDVHGHLYLDGLLVGKAGPQDLPTLTAEGPFRIGAESGGRFIAFFEGKIDEVEVFDRALIGPDFASLYASQDDGRCELDPALSCGSRGLGPCPAGQFCAFGAGTGCGGTDIPGICRTPPIRCTGVASPVCGCDGETYASECEAHRRGVAVALLGPC